MAVIEDIWRLLRVWGGYFRYVAVILGMWRLLLVCGDYYRYVAVILVCGGYVGMWQLYWYVAVM